MLTSYLVHCPNIGCNWFGSLLPSRNTDSWRSLTPTTNVATFECPECQQSWRAKIVGDDVEAMPSEALPESVV